MPEMKLPSRYIATITADCCNCTLTPESLSACAGDVVVYQNLTSETVVLLFPKPELFATDRLELQSGQITALTVRSVPFDSYSYFLYCETCKGSGDRSTLPRIIIYKSVE